MGRDGQKAQINMHSVGNKNLFEDIPGTSLIIFISEC